MNDKWSDDDLPGIHSLPRLNLPHTHSEALLRSRIQHGPDPKPYRLSVQTVTLARLCDKAVEEWEFAREAIRRHANRPHNATVHWFLAATNNMETFINTLERALKIAESIRKNPDASAISRTELPTKSDRYRVGEIRDQVEHLHERIWKRKVVPGDPSFVLLKQHSIELGEQEIAYDELAWWISQLSNFAEVLQAHEAATAPGWLAMQIPESLDEYS